MTKSILQNGDLLFMSDESELSKAIIETTEKYSHVGIYFDGYIYHASRKRGVAKQKLEDYLTEEKRDIYIYRYPMIDAEIVMERAERYLSCEVPLLLVCAEHEIHRLQLVEPGGSCAEVLVQLAQRHRPESVAARRRRLV